MEEAFLCQYWAYWRLSLGEGFSNTLSVSPITVSIDSLLPVKPRWTIRQGRIKLLEVIGGTDLYSQHESKRPWTYEKNAIVVLETVDLIEEERAVRIGDHRVEILQDEDTRSLGPSPAEDLSNAKFLAVRIYLSADRCSA